MREIYTTFGPEGFGNYEVDWSTPEPTYTAVNKSARKLLLPGFVDVHIHGAFGIDFMSAGPSDLKHLCKKLEACGYEALLPTTITAGATEVAKAVDNLPDHEMIAGFHLEGPFISSQFPGAQPKSSISEPPVGSSEWDSIFDHPKLKLVTLAPELPHALALAASLMKRGVVVSMGHTNATYEESRRGFEFGISHATHTFNAMRAFHHREAGAVGYVLMNESMTAELIYDRIHVSPDSAKLLVKCKGPEGVVAVSDSSAATGLPPGTKLEMWGHKVVVDRGSVRLTDGTLAGSAITLLDAFRNLEADFGTELAMRACCINPRRVLGMTGNPRVLVELDHARSIVGRKVRQLTV